MAKIGFASLSMQGGSWFDGLKAAVENDFASFELCCEYPDTVPGRISDDQINEVLEIQAKSGIEICVHAPFFEMNIAALCPGIRSVSIKEVKAGATLASRLGARVLVVHSGQYGTPGPAGATRHNFEPYRQIWENNIEALKEIVDFAGEKGVTVCLENLGLGKTIDADYETLLEIRENVDPSLKYTFDMGHARLTEGVQKAIDVLGDNIRHIHITDNMGEWDDHLPLGDGNSDFSDYVDFINAFPYVMTMEIVDAGNTPEASLKSRRFISDLLLG